MRRIDFGFKAAAFGLILGAGGVSRADLILTAEAPGVQATSVSGVTTEAFDAKNSGYFGGPLATNVGSFSSAGFINGADQYGGAGGAGKYLAFGYAGGAQTTTLTLNGPQSYFGFWWSAADAGNGVELFSHGALVGTLNTNTVLATLGALSPGYLGNPNAAFSGQNPTEEYAYLNIFGRSGTSFDTIVFTDTERGTLFEMDNLSTRATVVPPAYPGTVIANGIASPSAVPEPASLTMVVLGGLGLLGYHRRSRGSSAPIA